MDANVTFDTICHNPAHALYGLLLDDYNNSKCQMKEIKGMGSQFFICSCSEDECNEHVLFNPSKCSTFTPSATLIPRVTHLLVPAGAASVTGTA